MITAISSVGSVDVSEVVVGPDDDGSGRGPPQAFSAALQSTPAMIEVEGLTKVYVGSKGVRAIDNVSFTVPEKSVFGFLGPNGAGKTTTIRILGTVLEPTAGTLRIDGHDIGKESMAVKEGIGLMPDEVLYYPTLPE